LNIRVLLPISLERLIKDFGNISAPSLPASHGAGPEDKELTELFWNNPHRFIGCAQGELFIP
jgi:hypothetical protein